MTRPTSTVSAYLRTVYQRPSHTRTGLSLDRYVPVRIVPILFFVGRYLASNTLMDRYRPFSDFCRSEHARADSSRSSVEPVDTGFLSFFILMPDPVLFSVFELKKAKNSLLLYMISFSNFLL